jgi:hypothetical protein
MGRIFKSSSSSFSGCESPLSLPLFVESTSGSESTSMSPSKLRSSGKSVVEVVGEDARDWTSSIGESMVYGRQDSDENTASVGLGQGLLAVLHGGSRLN